MLYEVLVEFMFNVTVDNISVMYVMAYTCAGRLKKLDLYSGSYAIHIS